MRRIGRDSPFIEAAHAYGRPDYAIQGYKKGGGGRARVNSEVVRVSELQCERGDRPGTVWNTEGICFRSIEGVYTRDSSNRILR